MLSEVNAKMLPLTFVRPSESNNPFALIAHLELTGSHG